jgi:hypothetical protein
MNEHTIRNRWTIVLTAIALFSTLIVATIMIQPAEAAVTMADINPSYRNDGPWDFTANWQLTWEATGANTWKFYYGDGGYKTIFSVGSDFDDASRTFGSCFSGLEAFKTQRLKIGAVQYATSSVRLSKTSPAC